MKALKIIGIIVGVLVAAILIIPLFVSSPVVVSAETDIALEPEQILPSLASFDSREDWDPWVAKDSTTEVTVKSKPGYVGSTYQWTGELIGSGRMEVTSVTENSYISANLWFGDAEEPALVEWNLRPSGIGTIAQWSFSMEAAYPFGRLSMLIGKSFLMKDFEAGLANLKKLLEANPPSKTPLGPISVEVQDPFEAMVAKGAGTMEEMAQQMGMLYGMVFAEVGKQQLEVAGPVFVHYLDYDEAAGFSNYLAGVPVSKKGKDAGDVMAVSYEEMKVVQGLHTGPYEEFKTSYGLLGAHIENHSLEVTGEAFEFYIVSMQQEEDSSKWRTRIAFPLK